MDMNPSGLYYSKLLYLKKESCVKNTYCYN